VLGFSFVFFLLFLLALYAFVFARIHKYALAHRQYTTQHNTTQRNTPKLLEYCLSENCRPFIPDDISLGVQLFFLAQCQIVEKQYAEAERCLQECAQTHWVDSRHNHFLLSFCHAKLLQCQGKHEEAIPVFNKAIDLSDNDSHCYFRRAWSYKVRFEIGKCVNE
jgi:tetratricopeptide (TPR) repeat protein